ncbi:hypothetical protein KIPB_009427, partial [Kipferlia bialata]
VKAELEAVSAELSLEREAHTQTQKDMEREREEVEAERQGERDRLLVTEAQLVQSVEDSKAILAQSTEVISELQRERDGLEEALQKERQGKQGMTRRRSQVIDAKTPAVMNQNRVLQTRVAELRTQLKGLVQERDSLLANSNTLIEQIGKLREREREREEQEKQMLRSAGVSSSQVLPDGDGITQAVHTTSISRADLPLLAQISELETELAMYRHDHSLSSLTAQLTEAGGGREQYTDRIAALEQSLADAQVEREEAENEA